jgi:hypothetical protein
MWQMLYLVVFFAILILWRPDNNSRRYAYAELQSTDDMDSLDDGVEIVGLSLAQSETVQRERSSTSTPSSAAVNGAGSSAGQTAASASSKESSKKNLPKVYVTLLLFLLRFFFELIVRSCLC